jgi:hypothetical protein
MIQSGVTRRASGVLRGAHGRQSLSRSGPCYCGAAIVELLADPSSFVWRFRVKRCEFIVALGGDVADGRSLQTQPDADGYFDSASAAAAPVIS